MLCHVHVSYMAQHRPSCASISSDFWKFGQHINFDVQHKNMYMAICIGFVGYNKIKLRYCHPKMVANSPLLCPKSILYAHADKISFGDQTVQLDTVGILYSHYHHSRNCYRYWYPAKLQICTVYPVPVYLDSRASDLNSCFPPSCSVPPFPFLLLPSLTFPNSPFPPFPSPHSKLPGFR